MRSLLGALSFGLRQLATAISVDAGALEIKHSSRSAAARRPLLHLESPVRASERSPGQARAGAPRAALGQRSDQFFSSPPESPAFGRFGGRGREAVNKSIFRHGSFRFDRFFLRTGQVKANYGGFRACFSLPWRPLGPLFGASPATRHTSPYPARAATSAAACRSGRHRRRIHC